MNSKLQPSPSMEKAPAPPAAAARVSIEPAAHAETIIATVVRTLQEGHQQQMHAQQKQLQEAHQQEIQQLQQQLQEAKQKQMDPLSMDDEFSDELDRELFELNDSEAKASMTEGSTASVTFDEAATFRRDYENRHMKNWMTTEPREILRDIVKHHRLQLDDESNPISARTGLGALRCANRLFVHEKRATNATLDFVRKMCDSRSRKMSKIQRATGEYNGCITLTQKDVRHLIHSVIDRYGDATLPTVEIQNIQQLVMQCCSGRRVCELQFVAPADFEYYVFVNDSGGIVYRVIVFWFCWSKALGPGRYKQNCRESVNGSNVEAAPVMWTLLLLQRLGIIEDAADAYHGRGAYAPKQFVKAGQLQKGTVDLGIDKTEFLSTAEFVAILKAASKKHATEMHEYLLSDPNRDDGTDDADGSVRLGDYTLPAKLDSSLRAHIASQGKKPLYREIYLGQYPMSAQQPQEQRRRLLTESFKKAGYLNSRQMNIGGTGARKWFAVSSRRSVGGIDLALNNDSQLMNSSQVRHSHYIDHNSYRGSVPANLADGNSSAETDQHIAEMMLEDPVAPAYTMLGFFDRENFTPVDASLGGVADFLVKYAGMSPNKVPFACPFRGCSAQIESSGNYVRHLHELCPQRENQDAICPCCNTTLAYNPERKKSTASVFLVHLEQACAPAREMMQPLTIRKRNAMTVAKAKNPSLRNVLCTGCNCKFPSQSALAKHLRESLTCAASKNRKEGSLTKDHKWMEKFRWAERVSQESPGALQHLITQQLPPGSDLRPLKQWLAMQRRKDRQLSPEKEELLRSIGYYDVTGKPEKRKNSRRVTREEYARQLQDYRNQNRGKNPSMKYKHPDGGSLGKWLNSMRTRYNQNVLSSEQAMWVVDNGVLD